MGIVIDIIIIALIVLSTFLAYKKGLVALAVKLCAVIIAVVATVLLYKPISNFIVNTTNIDESIQNAILEKSFELMKNEDSSAQQVMLEQATTNTLTQTSRELSIQIINVCVMIILYFGIKLVLRFITVIADKIANLPIVNKFNKAGGLIYGLIRGFVIVYACLLLISFVGRVNTSNYIYKTVEESSLGKIMSDNNIFNVLL